MRIGYFLVPQFGDDYSAPTFWHRAVLALGYFCTGVF